MCAVTSVRHTAHTHFQIGFDVRCIMNGRCSYQPIVASPGGVPARAAGAEATVQDEAQVRGAAGRGDDAMVALLAGRFPSDRAVSGTG